MYLRKMGGLRRTNRGEAVSGSGGGGARSQSKMRGLKSHTHKSRNGSVEKYVLDMHGYFFALQEDFSLADIRVDERWRILSKQN